MFEITSKHFGTILITVIMKELPNDFRLQVSTNIPKGKREISRLLEEF